MRTRWIVLVVLWAWLPSATASACKPVPPEKGRLSHLVVVGEQAKVDPSRLRLDCGPAGPWWDQHCKAEATERVHNPTSDPISTTLLALRTGLRAKHTRADGGTLAIRGATEDESRTALRRLGLDPATAPQEGVIAFDIQLEPGESTELVTTFQIEFGSFIDGCSMPAVYLKHPLVHRGAFFAWLSWVAPETGVQASLEIETPRAYVANLEGQTTRKTTAGRMRHAWSGQHSSETEILISRKAFDRGGPFVAAGAEFDDGVGPRLRAGWEFSLTEAPWLLFGAAAETDLRSVSIVPHVEVATPNAMMIVPSAGLGLGVPVRTWPDPAAGIRAMGSLSWPFISLVGALDVFHRREGAALEGALMLQAGF